MPRRGRQRSFLQEMFLSNWNNKGTALLLAAILWGIALATTLDSRTLTVTVELVCKDPDEVVISANSTDSLTPFDRKVTLKLRGQLRLLTEAEKRRKRARIEVSDEQVIALADKSHYDLPRGVEVVSADPAFIQLETEERILIPVTVAVKHTGAIRDGRYSYDRNQTQVDPKQVPVLMPQSYRNSVEVWTSLDLDDVGENRALELDLKLAVTDSKLVADYVRFAPTAPKKVAVVPGLVDATDLETRSVKILFAIEPATPSAIDSVKEVRITCKGTRPQLDEWLKRVELGSFFIVFIATSYQNSTIDFNQPETYDYVHLPAGVEVTDWEKTQIAITVKDPLKTN